MVGLSSILSGGGSQTHVITTGDMLLGMGLVVASQARPAAPPAQCASGHTRRCMQAGAV